ncbi:MAG: hypothetical protein LC799_35440, partial [Actinobacteria bacterium]|nr:hypothetical protein [Actinomycetota bacterium]
RLPRLASTSPAFGSGAMGALRRVWGEIVQGGERSRPARVRRGSTVGQDLTPPCRAGNAPRLS